MWILLIALFLFLIYIFSEQGLKQKTNYKPYGIIYKIENKINHKVYIGQTTQKTVWHRYNCVNDHSKIVYNTHNQQLKRDMIRYGLRNFEITDAKNGYEALDLLTKKEEKYDAMLLDVMMPVIDGFSVLQLMENNRVEKLPIIMMTAEATKENVRRAGEYGVTYFVSKPFDAETVLEKVHTLLNIEQRTPLKDIGPLKEYDINDTNMYIGRLQGVYKEYLKNRGVSDERYKRVSELTRILMTQYASQFVGDEYEPAKINMNSVISPLFSITAITSSFFTISVI